MKYHQTPGYFINQHLETRGRAGLHPVGYRREEEERREGERKETVQSVPEHEAERFYSKRSTQLADTVHTVGTALHQRQLYLDTTSHQRPGYSDKTLQHRPGYPDTTLHHGEGYPDTTLHQRPGYQKENQDKLFQTNKKEHLFNSGKQEKIFQLGKEIELFKPSKQEELFKSSRQEELFKPSKQEEPFKLRKKEDLLKSGKQEDLVNPRKQEELFKPGKQEVIFQPENQKELFKSGKLEEFFKPWKSENTLLGNQEELFNSKKSEESSCPKFESVASAKNYQEETSSKKLEPAPTVYRSCTVSSSWNWKDIFSVEHTEEDLPKMTEDLWYHALRFLDKYRTDTRNYDIEELYEFADKTGILERHKQLLAKPYHDSQIDMKIMYYELIKMLIEYERKNHPEQYDATKTVGKIEGYQELTNKLQRYLNQRFIEDIDKLGDAQLQLGEINISQQFTTIQENINNIQQKLIKVEEKNLSLEENLTTLQHQYTTLNTEHTDLRETHLHLETRVGILETTNSSLLLKVQGLKEKEEQLEELVSGFRKQQEMENSAMKQELEKGGNQISNHEDRILVLETETVKMMELNTQQDARIEALENGSHALDNKLSDLESADVFLQEANKQLAVRTTEIENKSKKIEVDFSQVTEEFQKGFTLKVESKLEKMEESLDVLNKNKINNDAKMSDLIARLDEHDDKIENMQTDIETGKNIMEKLSSTTENISEIISQTQKQITNVAENVEKNEKDITNIFSSLAKLNSENQDMHSESKLNITRIYEAIHEQQISLENTIKELNSEHDKVTSFELLISALTAETDGLKAQISHEMQTSVENFEEGQNKLKEAFKEHLSNFSAQASKLDKVETDADVTNSDLKKLLERFSKLQNDLQSLDVKHVETVERMKEVTVLATNIEVHVKSQEQRIEQQNEEGLTNVNKKIAMIEGDLDTAQKKIADLDSKGLSLSGNVQTINQTLVSKLDELKKITDDLEAKLSNASADHSKKMEAIQDLYAESTDKIKGLEEASMQHFERARYFETLNTRVAQLDEMRQQSEAKARDEVDMGISKQNSLVNEFKLDVDNKVQNITLQFQENFYKSEQENNQLKEQILHLKAEIEKCYLSINGLNGEFGNITGKIQDLESGFDTQLKNISAKTDYAESSLAKEVEQLNDKASELNSKLKYLEHENMNNIAEIVAMKEASFAHNEKVTFVEALSARVSSFDDSRQQFEEDLIRKNEEMIAKNASAITDLKQECEGRLEMLEAETKSGFAKTADANDGLAVSLENLRKENENLGTWFKDLQERHVQLNFILTEQNQTNQTFVLEKQQELEAKIEKSLLQSQENIKTEQESGMSELREMIETTSNNLRAEIQDKADKENVEKLEMFKNSLKIMEDKIEDVATGIQKAEENFAAKVDENVLSLRSDLEEKLKEQEYDCKELYKTNEKLQSKVEILEMGISAQLEDIEKLREQDEVIKQEVKDTQEAETSRCALMQNSLEERMKTLEDKLDQFQTSLGESQLNQNEIIIRESKEIISKMKIEIDQGAAETDKHFRDGLKAMEEKIQKLETDVLSSLENKLVQEIKDSHLVLKGETGLKIKTLEDDIEGQKLVIEDKFNNCLEQLESNKVQLKTEVGNSSRELLSEIQNDLDAKLANIDIFVKEAEKHVENLRSLNGKLIDQVKENMKGHEVEQEKIAENLKQQTDGQLEKYKKQVEDELKTIISIKDEHTLTLTSMSNTIISVRETLSKSIEEFKETEKRIDALEKGQIVQDEEIDKNKETLKDQLQDLMAKIALNQSDLEHHLTIYEDEKKMTQQRLDDSGISMSEIDEKLSFLAENNETKDQTINEMNKSFETSIHVFSSQFETKLAEDHKAFTDRLQRAEDNVRDNSMAIKANTSLIQQNGDNIASLLTTSGKHDEEFVVIKVEIQKLQVNEQKESEESLKKVEILSSKVESEIKRLDQIKHQVSDLDDAVTHLSPDIITNAEKILVLEVFKEKLEASTENLQKEVEEVKSAEEKSRSEIEELKEDTEKLGEILETLQDKFDNLKKETSDRFKDDNTKIEEVSGLLSNIKLSVEENNAALQSQLQELKKDQDAKTVILGNDVIDLRNQLTKFERQFSEVPLQLEEHKKNTEDEIKNLKEKQFDDVKNLKDQLDEFLDKFAIVQATLDEIKATNVKMENIENNISQQFNLKIASSMMESKDAQEENQKRLDELKENLNEETAKLSVIIMSMKSSFEDSNKLIIDDIDKLKSADNELMNEINNNKNSLNLKLESLNSEAQSLIGRVTGVENENKEQNDCILHLETNQKDQLEKIVSLYENTAAYEEKSKYVQVLEAKVEKVDEMRQKSESQTKEDFKQAIMTNKDNIEKLRADVDKSIQELGEKHDDDMSNLSSAVAEMKNNFANNVREVKEDCNILKSEGVVFKDTLTKYQELLEVKLKEVDNNTNENSRVIQDVKDMLNETNDKIDTNQATFNTGLNSLKDETPALIEKTLDFFKTDVKEEITVLNNDFNELKKNIEPLELGFTKLGKELEENSQKQSASLNDLKNVSQDMLAVLRNDFDGKVKEIMEYFDKQGKTIALNNTYMMSSQELLHNISISSTEQAEKIEALESQTGILDNKLCSLESADLFLQEAHRMLTDKTTLVEAESKRLEASVLAHMKNQKEEHEDTLKSQITLILKDIDKLEADKSKAFERINDIENQAHGNQNQITVLEAKFLNQTNDLSTNLETMIADMKTSQENKLEVLEENIVLNKAILQNSIEDLNNNLKGNDEKIKQIEGSLKILDVKHVETTQKMKEVTVLATNIEVHVKSQEQKFEEQKALDMTGFENSFKELKEKEVMLQEKLESLKIDCQGTMQKIDDLEFKDKEKNALVDASIHDIHAKLQSFDDHNKIQGEKMHVIEMLSDRLDQLDESRSTHDLHVTTTIENLREEYKKNLALINLEIDNKLTALQDTELSTLHQITEALKGDLVNLRTENEGQGRSIIELGNNYKEVNARYEEHIKILETKLSQALSEIQILLAKVESIDDENKYNKEKLVAMEEAAVTQSEKAVYVESLMSRMDDMRQQSEVKSKEELQTKIQSQTKAVDELRNELEAKLGSISRDIRGELDSLNSAQEQLRSKLHLDNKAALETLENEQETKFTAIMKIIHDHKTLIEKTHSSITTITERIVHTESSQSNSQEKIIADYAQKLSELKENFEERIVELFMQSGVQKAHIDKNTSLIEELSAEFNSSSLQLRGEITNIKEHQENERNLIVSQIQEDHSSLEALFNSLETRVESTETTLIKESSRMESLEKFFHGRTQKDDELYERVFGLEKASKEHEDLIVNVEKSASEKAEECDMQLKDYKKTNKDELQGIRAEMETDKENLWTLIIEIYSAFRGSTVVLKSEGAVKHHQADVLGVYRMVDNYNDRPVYKQDGGENYIYYSATSNSWLVGTVVGHQYGWLRNPSENAGKRRWIPDLSTGWEYRPLIRNSELNNTWCTDDGTLRIESLRDVEKVNELIRDIKNSKEVD